MGGGATGGRRSRIAGFGLAVLLGCSTGGGGEMAEPDWVGTTWRVEEIEGHPLAEGTTSTLGFPETGRVAGLAACNRYTGFVVLEGDRIVSLGPLVATRMMCPLPVMEQERLFMVVLERARRLQRDGERLIVFGEDDAQPLMRLRPAPTDEDA